MVNLVQPFDQANNTQLKINDDGSINTRSTVQYKLLYTDETDFAKGTDTNTETSETGSTAVLQLLENTDNDDDIPYTTEANYTLSDGAKLEVDGGSAQLKSQTGGTKNWIYTTPANYTYDSVKVKAPDGDVELLDLTPTDSTFYADYESDINGTWGDGVLTGTPTGSPSVSGGFLDLTGGTQQYVDYAGAGNADTLIQQGCIRFRFKPNYTGAPSALRGMMEVLEGHNLNKNRIGFYHNSTTQHIYFYDGTGTYIHSLTYTFSPTAGQVYEIEVNWDFDIGNSRVFLDGVLKASNLTQTMTRNNTIGLIRVGSNNTGTWNPDSYFGDVLLFDAVQHTAGYTPNWTGVPATKYSMDSPSVETDNGFAFISALNTFVETSTKPAGTGIKHQVSSDNGTTYKWWNGSVWVVRTGSQTDEWYYDNESNLATVINTNIGTLASSGTLTVVSFLESTAGEETPLLDNISSSSGASYSTTDNLYIDTKDITQIAPALIYSWLTATITNTLPTNTDIRILFSTDGRASWITFTGGSWQAPVSATARANAASITDAQNNFASIGLGSGTLDVRVFLYTSDNSVTPEIDNINVISEAGYETSGNWESDEYDSANESISWGKVYFNAKEVSGSTIIVQGRAGNYSTNLGDYTTLTNNTGSGLIGQYLQWKVIFTGPGDETPNLEDYYIMFDTPVIREISP